MSTSNKTIQEILESKPKSERNLQDIFDRYNHLCQNAKVKPILLVEEADALFAKRNENPSDSIDKTENTLANICLQAMERIDGCIIATTNLVPVFDDAFERRFQFKIPFFMPSAEVRAKMWRSKLKLPLAQARRLAREYAFSGGQIDNICMKATIQGVLHGADPGIDEIIRYCDEEFLVRTDSDIKVS